MKIKISSDRQKAKALLIMARTTLERLNESDIEIYVSNSLLDFYDIIYKIMESITFSDGVKIKGEGAHLD